MTPTAKETAETLAEEITCEIRFKSAFGELTSVEELSGYIFSRISDVFARLASAQKALEECVKKMEGIDFWTTREQIEKDVKEALNLANQHLSS